MVRRNALRCGSSDWVRSFILWCHLLVHCVAFESALLLVPPYIGARLRAACTGRATNSIRGLERPKDFRFGDLGGCAPRRRTAQLADGCVSFIARTIIHGA